MEKEGSKFQIQCTPAAFQPGYCTNPSMYRWLQFACVKIGMAVRRMVGVSLVNASQQ